MREARFSVDRAVNYRCRIWDQGGVVTWDVLMDLDGIFARLFCRYSMRSESRRKYPLTELRSGCVPV